VPESKDRPPTPRESASPPLANGDQVDALTRAALELDQATATTIMHGALRAHGVVDAWTDILAPALRRRGERFDRTADGVAAEHLLSECTRTALSAVIWRRRRWNRCPPVLLAAPDGEQHVLPLHALAAALAEVHQPSVLLGASTPPRALLDAAAQLAPTVIFLWAHTPDTARHAELTTLRHHPDQMTLVLGGPGWPLQTAGQVDDLAAALRACTRPTLPARRGSTAQSDLAS
jgi:MerR family transcriptional regulator, light-induced transcriptional regulator